MKIFAEEPVGPNSYLLSLNEATGVLELASYEIDTVYRYRLECAHGLTSGTGSLNGVFRWLMGVLQPPQYAVAVWAHDETGHMKFRHLNRVHRFHKHGYEVATSQGLGLACRKLENPSLLESHIANNENCGWFVAFGESWEARLFACEPFRRTLESMGKNSRLAPSREFLEGIAQHSGGVMYYVSSDQQDPSIVVVSSDMLPSLRDAEPSPPEES